MGGCCGGNPKEYTARPGRRGNVSRRGAMPVSRRNKLGDKAGSRGIRWENNTITPPPGCTANASAHPTHTASECARSLAAIANRNFYDNRSVLRFGFSANLEDAKRRAATAAKVDQKEAKKSAAKAARKADRLGPKAPASKPCHAQEEGEHQKAPLEVVQGAQGSAPAASSTGDSDNEEHEHESTMMSVMDETDTELDLFNLRRIRAWREEIHRADRLLLEEQERHREEEYAMENEMEKLKQYLAEEEKKCLTLRDANTTLQKRLRNAEALLTVSRFANSASGVAPPVPVTPAPPIPANFKAARMALAAALAPVKNKLVASIVAVPEDTAVALPERVPRGQGLPPQPPLVGRLRPGKGSDLSPARHLEPVAAGDGVSRDHRPSTIERTNGGNQ